VDDSTTNYYYQGHFGKLYTKSSGYAKQNHNWSYITKIQMCPHGEHKLLLIDYNYILQAGKHKFPKDRIKYIDLHCSSAWRPFNKLLKNLTIQTYVHSPHIFQWEYDCVSRSRQSDLCTKSWSTFITEHKQIRVGMSINWVITEQWSKIFHTKKRVCFTKICLYIVHNWSFVNPLGPTRKTTVYQLSNYQLLKS
jgi:hypothetical protein